MDYWAKRGRGRGTFQRGRGRFNFKKSGSSPKWTHDKYQGDGIVEDEEETIENNEEKDRRKEEKVNSLVNCRLDGLSCSISSTCRGGGGGGITSKGFGLWLLTVYNKTVFFLSTGITLEESCS